VSNCTGSSGVVGINPSLALALLRGAASAAELASIPDTDELRAADEAIVRCESSNGEGTPGATREVRARRPTPTDAVLTLGGLGSSGFDVLSPISPGKGGKDALRLDLGDAAEHAGAK
jgi:hypothetical protein